jgi:hypothetical protein
MAKPLLPKDFDWVKARKACSADKVFESIHLAAKANVDAMKTATANGETRNLFQFSTFGDSFSVVWDNGWEKRGVRFYLEQRTLIVAEPFRVPNGKTLKAGLTLNDDGECRLVVDGDELQEWQFLKRALEPLFFAPED